MMSKTCSGTLAQLAGIGKEISDIVKGCLMAKNLPQVGNEFIDAWQDIVANNQCINWEMYIPVVNWVTAVFIRDSCFNCCNARVGYFGLGSSKP